MDINARRIVRIACLSTLSAVLFACSAVTINQAPTATTAPTTAPTKVAIVEPPIIPTKTVAPPTATTAPTETPNLGNAFFIPGRGDVESGNQAYQNINLETAIANFNRRFTSEDKFGLDIQIDNVGRMSATGKKGDAIGNAFVADEDPALTIQDTLTGNIYQANETTFYYNENTGDWLPIVARENVAVGFDVRNPDSREVIAYEVFYQKAGTSISMAFRILDYTEAGSWQGKAPDKAGIPANQTIYATLTNVEAIRLMSISLTRDQTLGVEIRAINFGQRPIWGQELGDSIVLAPGRTAIEMQAIAQKFLANFAADAGPDKQRSLPNINKPDELVSFGISDTAGEFIDLATGKNFKPKIVIIQDIARPDIDDSFHNILPANGQQILLPHNREGGNIMTEAGGVFFDPDTKTIYLCTKHPWGRFKIELLDRLDENGKPKDKYALPSQVNTTIIASLALLGINDELTVARHTSPEPRFMTSQWTEAETMEIWLNEFFRTKDNKLDAFMFEFLVTN